MQGTNLLADDCGEYNAETHIYKDLLRFGLKVSKTFNVRSVQNAFMVFSYLVNVLAKHTYCRKTTEWSKSRPFTDFFSYLGHTG